MDDVEVLLRNAKPGNQFSPGCVLDTMRRPRSPLGRELRVVWRMPIHGEDNKGVLSESADQAVDPGHNGPSTSHGQSTTFNEIVLYVDDYNPDHLLYLT